MTCERIDVQVRILDNLELMAMWPMRGYQPGDPLRCVYEYSEPWPHNDDGEPLPPDVAMEIIAWDAASVFNRDDRPNGQYAKSFTPGDVLQINYGDGTVYLVADVDTGWRRIDLDEPPEFNNSPFERYRIHGVVEDKS
jgi:hypothetical protein